MGGSMAAVGISMAFLAASPPERVRVVATSATGSVWRLAPGTIERRGPAATAWFFVDHTRDRTMTAASSRVRYRFDCPGRRATRMERVVLGATGRVLGHDGAGAQEPAGRGTFKGTLLDATCGRA